MCAHTFIHMCMYTHTHIQTYTHVYTFFMASALQRVLLSTWGTRWSCVGPGTATVTDTNHVGSAIAWIVRRGLGSQLDVISPSGSPGVPRVLEPMVSSQVAEQVRTHQAHLGPPGPFEQSPALQGPLCVAPTVGSP